MTWDKILQSNILSIVFAALSIFPSLVQAQVNEESYNIGLAIMNDVHHGLVYRNKEEKNENNADPILNDLHGCIAKHGDTVGTSVCLGAAYQAYDKIMNQIYQSVLAKNDDETKKSLQLAQQKWISFRNLEKAAQINYAKAERGTVIGIALGYQKLTAIRERISELMMYLGADQG